MKKEDFSNFINGIQKKLGKENSSKIADDLGKLITDNSQMNTELEQKEEQIQKLKTDKENLITANGNLLQQVAMGEKEDLDLNNKNNDENKPNEPFSFKKQFDKNGNFID